MNKKGLTLVQFAGAVIVLSIIIILLWPQFEKIIDKSRRNTFISASRQLLNSSNASYVKYQKAHYSNVNSSYPKLTTDKEGYQYIVVVNKIGNPTEFKITNGRYKVEGFDENGIRIDKIGELYKVEEKENVEYVLLANGTFEEREVETKKKKK